MRNTLKTVHMLGLALFLGSIAVYLTLPGLLATIASGLGLLWVNRRQLQRWQIAKAVVGFVLLSNTWLLVEPAIKSAAMLSTVTIYPQQNRGELALALNTETLAGAVNIALAGVEIWLAVFRPALCRRHRVQASLALRS